MTVAKDDRIVYLFRYIVNFINDLNETFGETETSLQLYNLLLEKTGIINEEPIKKHINVFTTFLEKNKEGILDKDFKKMELLTIEYSEKVKVDLQSIFEKADEDNKKVIWEYLLSLLAVFIPESNAKDKILSEKVKNVTTENEGDFLQNLIKKVEKNIDPTQDNPSEIMSNILSNGFFNEVVEDLNKGLVDGNLDLGKMMSSLQGVIGSLPNLMNDNNNS